MSAWNCVCRIIVPSLFSRTLWDSDLTKNDIWMIISENDQVTFCCLLQQNVSCGRSQNHQAFYEWLYADTSFFLNNILKVSLVGEGTIRFCQIKTNITIRPSGVSTMKLERTFLKKSQKKQIMKHFFRDICKMAASLNI